MEPEKQDSQDLRHPGIYRWEFLRRSDEYLQDFREFRSDYADWIACGFQPGWPYEQGRIRGEDPDHPPIGGFALTAIGRLRAFTARWRFYPIDPDITPIRFEMKGPWWILDEAAAREWAEDPNVLILGINTAGPMEELLRQLEWRIGLHQKERTADQDDTEPEPKTRRRLDKYPAYLTAWDMGKAGKTDREIADEMGLNDEKAAARYRKRAKDLIKRAVKGEWQSM